VPFVPSQNRHPEGMVVVEPAQIIIEFLGRKYIYVPLTDTVLDVTLNFPATSTNAVEEAAIIP